MMKFVRAGALLLVVGAARAAGAQDMSALIANDRAASAELAAIIAATQENGLPVEPIIAKIRYALLVAHAPSPKIISTARAMAARLDEARKALAPHPTDRDIAAGEDALNAGVSAQSLQNIRKVSANRPVAVPLGVLAQLVTSHVDEKRAAKIVTDLIKRGASGEQLVALGNEVNTDIAMGTQVNSALELRMNRLNAVLGLPSANGDAATSTLQFGDQPRKKP